VNGAALASATVVTGRPTAAVVAERLRTSGVGPFLATPCGVLAPLLAELHDEMIIVSREETAVGVAAGAALGGRLPVVLMQNSGFGASINALASLVQPYRIPMLLVISLRGVAPDATTENLVMGRATAGMLDLLGIAHRTLRAEEPAYAVEWAVQALTGRRQTVAVLVPPAIFDWSPS
jgi:sulfopyruvate decarboxylase subunit alpha